METVLATVAGLVIGFVGGLCAYRSSRRWCGGCGGTLTCRACTNPGGTTSRTGRADQIRSTTPLSTHRPIRRRRNTGPAGA